MNPAQKQFTRIFVIALVSIIVWAIGWEYFPEQRVRMTIAVVVINSPALLREFQNRKFPVGFRQICGAIVAKALVLWVMSLYGIAAAIFFVLAVTGRLDVSGISVPILLLMLAPLGTPGTVIYFENLGGE